MYDCRCEKQRPFNFKTPIIENLHKLNEWFSTNILKPEARHCRPNTNKLIHYPIHPSASYGSSTFNMDIKLYLFLPFNIWEEFDTNNFKSTLSEYLIEKI